MQRVLKWLGLALLVVAIAAAGIFFFVLPGLVEARANRVLEPPPYTASPEATNLHDELLVADLHADSLLWGRDLMVRSDTGQVDIPRLSEGNVALQVFSSVTKTPKGQNYDANGSDSDNITLLTVAQLQPPRTWRSILERSLYHASKLQSAADNSGGRLRFIRTSADLAKVLADRARGQQVTGAVFSVEGLQNLEGKLANLDRLQAAGMRMAGLTHFFDNEVAGSMHGIKKGGLTPLGRQVVTELDTARDAWSIASGNYSSRFAPAVAGAAKLAAERVAIGADVADEQEFFVGVVYLTVHDGFLNGH